MHQTRVFEYGVIPETVVEREILNIPVIAEYQVNSNTNPLRLKLHWENYFNTGKSVVRERINYGKIMHEIFSEIITADDINAAVRKKVIEGKIPESEESVIREKIVKLISQPIVWEWFETGNEVLNEVSVLMPDSVSKRPDRVILRNGKATIIDFKFGEEDPRYLSQVRHYRNLLSEMGYGHTEAFLWYVDADKIVNV